MIRAYTEDALVEQHTDNNMEQQLRWRSVLVWNDEDFGSVGLHVHESEQDVHLPKLMTEVVAV